MQSKQNTIESKLKTDIYYTIENGKLYIGGNNNDLSETAGSSLLGHIQNRLKKWGWLYYHLLKIFKPVWMNRQVDNELSKLLEHYDSRSFILNLGSGPNIVRKRFDIVNVDIFGFEEVDIVADAGDLPFEQNSVDLILNQAMLEHVVSPKSVVKEMYRVLRPGGEVFCYLPFIAPFHAAPHDYYRWTMPGIGELFKDFKEVEIGVGTGPTSGMLWVLQEWLAIFFSFGSRWLHDLIFLAMMILTAPIKMLDILLVKHPYADKIASGFFVRAKK